jgi:XrtJ-associated TM-motif-TM protein
MIKFRYAVLSAITLLSAVISVHAQVTLNGCTDSPEAPTALLMFVGTVGMFYGSSVLRKVLRRSAKK